MIRWLSRLFIVWVAIIFVASVNQEILHGGQQLVEASNEAASATTTGYAAFPPVESESRTADNALNTGKKARLQTDESDDELLTIGLGTRGAYPSHPSSLGQSSRPGVVSVLKEKPIHLAKNHEPFKFQTHDHWLLPSGVSLEQVSSQASSSTRRRDFLSDFDKTRETDASALTEHDIPLRTDPPESLSESFNLGRKAQFQIDAPITRGPLGNSVTHHQDGGRGTKRKMSNSWGQLLSLKTGVTSDENDAQHSCASPDFLSGFPWEHAHKLSAGENGIATPQFNPQEIQQVIQPFQLGSDTPSCQNVGASMAPVLSAGGTIPQEISPIARQNGGDVLLSLKPPEQGENAQSWGAYQGKTSFPRSQTKHSLRAEKNILVDWPRSTEQLLNQSTRPPNNLFPLGNQGSSSENPEHIPQVSMMPKPHQPEAIMAIDNHPSQIDGIKNCERLKFNTDLFKGDGPYQSDRSNIVTLLNSIPRPSRGNVMFTEDELYMAGLYLRKKHLIVSTPSMTEIRIFMGNIERWYQYWNTHAKIDLRSLHDGEEVLKCRFLFPVFLLYVEMIISIIPAKEGLPLGAKLDYPQEMRNAMQSYLDLNTLMETPPENVEYEIWLEKRNSFKDTLYHAKLKPSGIIWTFIEFWMKSHYTALWNHVIEKNGLHVCAWVKVFFNTIFTCGIKTLNEKLRYSLPQD